MLNPRNEIVALLRGIYAGPMIVHLAEIGVLGRIGSDPFCAKDFPDVSNQERLTSLFRYLASIGLMSSSDGMFEATELGRKVFERSGAFQILYSYRQYFDSLGDSLLDSTLESTVDRRRNIAGSGDLHSRKFFPSALDMCKGLSYSSVLDLGCGDGTFLDVLLTQESMTHAWCLDLSNEAVSVAKERLTRLHQTCEIEGIVANAGDVAAWAKQLTQPDLASLWFVVHEFCSGSTDVVVKFFTALHNELPSTDLLIGELVSHSPNVLSKSRVSSALPEFLLFHELSGQQPLTWTQWQNVRDRIPYTILNDSCVDAVANGEPSAFLWHLTPRK